ncbi:uncharacterized protein J3R85_008223 [Psidium guajava]|nr:uncharacterized protein J3R85_008223 [Psidium guajava]
MTSSTHGNQLLATGQIQGESSAESHHQSPPGQLVDRML